MPALLRAARRLAPAPPAPGCIRILSRCPQFSIAHWFYCILAPLRSRAAVFALELHITCAHTTRKRIAAPATHCSLHKSTQLHGALQLYGCFFMFCTLHHHQRPHSRRPSMCTLPPHIRERRNRTRAERTRRLRRLPAPRSPALSTNAYTIKRAVTMRV